MISVLDSVPKGPGSSLAPARSQWTRHISPTIHKAKKWATASLTATIHDEMVEVTHITIGSSSWIKLFKPLLLNSDIDGRPDPKAKTKRYLPAQIRSQTTPRTTSICKCYKRCEEIKGKYSFKRFSNLLLIYYCVLRIFWRC